MGACSVSLYALLVFRVFGFFFFNYFQQIWVSAFISTLVFIVRKLNMTVLSAVVFNSKRDTLMCMLLNQTEEEASDCVRI